MIRENAATIVPIVKPYAVYCYDTAGIYLFWIFLHYLSAKLYTYYCVPNDVRGFFMTPFLVSAPHCRAIRWSLHNGANTIDNMWIVLGTWLCTRILIRTGAKMVSNTPS